jgi:hypothetical protein
MQIKISDDILIVIHVLVRKTLNQKNLSESCLIVYNKLSYRHEFSRKIINTD